MAQDNLNHPLFEVKERAMIKLLQKIDYGIISINELIEDCGFMPRIICLLKDDSLVIKKYAIDLLIHILKVQEGLMKFQLCDGLNVLQDIHLSVPLSMKEKIDSLLNHYQKDFVASKREGSYKEYDLLYDVENKDCILHTLSAQSNNSLFQASNAENSFYEESTESLLHFKNPILFTTFPWLILTNLDNKILESTAKSLVETDNVTFNGIMIFCRQILFKDFPVEVLLQRPFIMQVLLSNLAEPDEANVWRKQEVICCTLAVFNRLLCSRMMKCDDIRENYSNESEINNKISKHSTMSMSGSSTVNSSCCSRNAELNALFGTINQRSSETVHESDDEDEFLILQMSQLSVINWCCQLLTLSIYLVGTSHPRLSSILSDLIPLTMEILRSCINPMQIWQAMSNEHMHLENKDLVKEITGSLLRGLNSLSRMLNVLYLKRDSNLSVRDAEENVRKLKNVSVIFKDFIKLFIPGKNFEMIFREQEVISLGYLLSDIGFYSEYPQDHCHLLGIFKELKRESAVQIIALVENIFRFQSCKLFLQISSSEIDRFQCEAERAVPILFIHKSRVFVEKMVRGLAKHVAAASDVTDVQVSNARKLIIQLLAYPDEQSRILSFRAIYNLISENVGISQAKNFTKNRSMKILILLHSRIINLLIFSGCSDSNPEVVEFSQNSILSLIRGFQLMESDVLIQLGKVFSKCLLNLQNLACSQTVLGRAILDLPYQLLKLSTEQSSLEIICTKFHLKCLLNKDEKVREQALRNCLALLVTFNSETFISPDLLGSSSEYCNLLILNHSVDLYASLPIVDNMDFYHLQMCIQIINNESKDASAMKTAWIQISFILHNPHLHIDLEKHWPIESTKQAFFNMMKVSGGGGATVSQVPTILEVLRLRAAYSTDTRSVLSSDLIFLMVSFKAMLFFKHDSRVQLEISLLLALLLNDDVLIQSQVRTIRNKDSSTSYCTASLPYVVSSSQYIKFYHENYKWEPDNWLNASIRELFSMLQSENLKIPISPILFYKPLWALICAENDSELSLPFDYAQNFSKLFKLTTIETVILRSYISKVYIVKLLTDIENATTHSDVKRALNVLESVLILVKDDFTKAKEVLRNDKWTGALSRFFLSLPSSSLDRQIFYHVMNVVLQLTKLISSITIIVGNIDCLCCSIVRLLITELAQEESALSSELRLTGNVNYDPLSPTADNLHSMLIFCCLTSNVSSVLHLHNQFKCNCQVMQINWSDLISNLSKIFTIIIKKCQVIPKFNLG